MLLSKFEKCYKNEKKKEEKTIKENSFEIC